MSLSTAQLNEAMTCEVRPLSAAQIAYYDKRNGLNNQIESELISATESGLCARAFKNKYVETYVFKKQLTKRLENLLTEKNQQDLDDEETELKAARQAAKRKRHTQMVYQTEALSKPTSQCSSDDDVPLAKRRDINIPSSSRPTTKSIASPSTSKKAKKKSLAKPIVQTPCESNALGGLTVKSNDVSKEMEGKTYPSLVVNVKPHLRVQELTGTRAELDSWVKSLLSSTASKFCQWLLKDGLVRTVQHCINHPTIELKLGSYSDVSKFVYTGGYVWLSECCPQNFTSVFYNSIFDGAQHPPQVILKLLYHWACQTPINNIIDWVKVDSLFVKSIYTWLRATCTLALHQNNKKLGGPNIFVEIGVISMGTDSREAQQRNIKVQVLGIFDHTTRYIRLRTADPILDSERNIKLRLAHLLEPLRRWVHRESIICIDMSIDKNLLQQMGFQNIIQATANDTTAKHTNANVMEYLRRIVPRMFHNTFTLLSRQMIQQFLDELSWRETYGPSTLHTFKNILLHLSAQTRLTSRLSFSDRLYQVATNPFKDWSVLASGDKVIPVNKSPKRFSER